MKPAYLSLLGGFALFVACGGVCAQSLNFNMTGQINSGTCAWSAADLDRTVALDPIGLTKLPASGGAGFVPFTIHIEKCTPGMNSATFTFSGTPDPNDPLRYKNSADATGVAIELESSDGLTLGANGTNSARTVPIVGDQASLDLRAGYWRVTGTPLSTGNVMSTALVTMSYD